MKNNLEQKFMHEVLFDGDLRRRERENEREFKQFLGMAGMVVIFVVALYFGITN